MCWARGVHHLTSAELQVGRVLHLWQDFFKLRCDDKDDFLAFYSRAKKILLKLKVEKLVTVQDNELLHEFFARVINAPELKDEANLFLKDFEKSPEAILVLVHSDYRAQETSK